MAEPVLVIHGVSNRRPEPSRAIVERLQKAVGDDVELVDVFWGDLGAATVGFEDAVPDAGAVGEEAVGGEAPTLLIPEDGPDAARATAEERALVIAANARPTDLETPDPVLYAVVLEQLERTVHLRRMGSPEALAATGRLIAEGAYAGAAAGAEEGPLKDLRDVVRGVMEEADRLVGAAVGEVLGRVNEEIRRRLVPTAAGFFGDVLAYEHHRAAIQQRVWEVIDARAPGRGTPGAPIHVAAHSLGGLVDFRPGQRKDDVAHEYLARVEGTEGVLFVGRWPCPGDLDRDCCPALVPGSPPLNLQCLDGAAPLGHRCGPARRGSPAPPS